MKTATLIYEPSLNGYSLKFDYDKNMVEFFKKTIPAHTRTSSGPPKWVWYFGREYFDIVKMLFEEYKDKYKRPIYKLTIVSEDEVKRFQEQQSHFHDSWTPSVQQYSIEDELRKFYNLIPHNGTSFDSVKKMTLSEAKTLYRKGANVYHPDRNNSSPSAAEKMCELNQVWTLLKEVYFVK